MTPIRANRLLSTTGPRRQRGLGAIAAIVIIVILAGMAAAIVATGNTQQMSSAQDILSARAWQAARAGNEWGLYQALRNNSCVAQSEISSLEAESGMHVTVYCSQNSFNEGGTTRRFYRIRAVACPASTCPSTDGNVIAGAGYVERTRVVVASND